MPRVNLIPIETLHQRIKTRRIRWWGTAVAVTWGLALVPLAIELNASYQLKSQKTALQFNRLK